MFKNLKVSIITLFLLFSSVQSSVASAWVSNESVYKGYTKHLNVNSFKRNFGLQLNEFISYQQNSIFDITSNSRIYSQSNAHSSAFKAETENSNVMGMFLLIGYGKMRYNVYEKSYYTMDYSITKGGGVSYEIPLQTFDGKFSVYNELGFSIFKAEANLHYGDTIGGDPVNNYYDVNLQFSPNTIFIANTLRYCLTKKEFKYYVSVGISQSFVISSTNLKQTLHTRQGSTKEYVEEFVPDPAVYGITVLATTGFSYRNFGFELRFDPGRNYSNKIHYAVYLPSLVGLFHVRFNPGKE